jgi:hypothetical protein
MTEENAFVCRAVVGLLSLAMEPEVDVGWVYYTDQLTVLERSQPRAYSPRPIYFAV